MNRSPQSATDGTLDAPLRLSPRASRKREGRPDPHSPQHTGSSDDATTVNRLPSQISVSNGNSDNNPNTNRKQPPLSAHDYIHAIYRHSRRSALTSTFPGRNYIDLANWLLPRTPNSRLPTENDSSLGGTKHWLAVLHHLNGYDHDRTQLLAQHDFSTLAATLKPPSRSGTLLFLRGYLPPWWIAEIGSRYRIDPEFFARHLDFFGPATYRNSFSSPSLISTDNNIIHIYVSTILTNDLAYSQVNGGFAARHKEIRDQLSKYKHQLPRSAHYGDSIVREYAVLSPQYAVIEQRISICISPDGEGWVGLIWMDNGRSLEASPAGPWTSDLELNNYSSREIALPVIQHYQKMAFKRIGDVQVNTGGVTGTTGTSPDGKPPITLSQCSAVLPLEYSSLLSAVGLARRATSSVLDALIPLFAHAAFSEVAFLNLLGELIEELIAPLPIDDFRSDCFERLQEYQVILERHADQLRHCLRALRVLQEAVIPPRPRYQPTPPHSEQGPRLDTPRSGSRRVRKESSPSSESQFPEASTYTATGVLEDYENLLDRCTRLQSRTAATMSTEMNRAMILESRRAMEQSERLKKLTLLATYFIPLTFTASIFGMNFEIFGQGNLPAWWYVILAAPLTLLTHLGSTLDLPAWKRRIAGSLSVSRLPWIKQEAGILSP